MRKAVIALTKANGLRCGPYNCGRGSLPWKDENPRFFSHSLFFTFFNPGLVDIADSSQVPKLRR